MAGVLLDQGDAVMLEAFVNKTAPQTLILCLFTNDIDPVKTHTEADFTEASGYDYAPISLTPGSWTTTPDAPSGINYVEQVFILTGALGEVYGYFLRQTTSGKAVAAERFSDGPYPIMHNGDRIKVTPKIAQDRDLRT